MEHENIMLFPRKSRISTNSHTSNTYIIKVWEEIGEPMEWVDEIDTINSATEFDTVVLDICSPGGILDTGILFNRALASTPAHTVAIVGPDCSSCASLIALSCREFVLDTTSQMMLHTSSYALRGKDVDIFEHSTFSRKQLRKIFEDVYLGAVSEEELEDIIKGTPLYFDADELEVRLSALKEYRHDKEEFEGEGNPDESVDLFDMIDERLKESIGDIGKLVSESVAKALSKYDLPVKQKPVRVKKSTKFDGTNGNGYQPIETGTQEPSPPKD